MKRIIAMLLAVVLVVALCACGGRNGSRTNETTVNEELQEARERRDALAELSNDLAALDDAIEQYKAGE